MPTPYRWPRITWGPGFGTTLDPAYPFDQCESWSEPRGKPLVETFPSGEQECWVPPTDHYLSGVMRWILPTDTMVKGPPGAAWHGTNGVQAWLAWAQQKHAFRLYPDRINAPNTYLTCILAAPTDKQSAELESDKTRKLTFTFRSSAEFTGY